MRNYVKSEDDQQFNKQIRMDNVVQVTNFFDSLNRGVKIKGNP